MKQRVIDFLNRFVTAHDVYPDFRRQCIRGAFATATVPSVVATLAASWATATPITAYVWEWWAGEPASGFHFLPLQYFVAAIMGTLVLHVAFLVWFTPSWDTIDPHQRGESL